MPDARGLGTVGLALDFLGVVLVFFWAPRGTLPVDDQHGKTHYIPTGKPQDSWISKLGIGMILVGFAVQMWALWLPGRSTSPDEVPVDSAQETPSGLRQVHTDCSGQIDVDFNAWIASVVDPTLIAGQAVWCQVWIRDPQPPSGGGSCASDAVTFVIAP